MNTYDEEALEETRVLLTVKPMTIRSLSRRFERSERTIKRWLNELRARGHRVVRDGIAVQCPYFIVTGRVELRGSVEDKDHVEAACL